MNGIKDVFQKAKKTPKHGQVNVMGKVKSVPAGNKRVKVNWLGK